MINKTHLCINQNIIAWKKREKGMTKMWYYLHFQTLRFAYNKSTAHREKHEWSSYIVFQKKKIRKSKFSQIVWLGSSFHYLHIMSWSFLKIFQHFVIFLELQNNFYLHFKWREGKIKFTIKWRLGKLRKKFIHKLLP